MWKSSNDVSSTHRQVQEQKQQKQQKQRRLQRILQRKKLYHQTDELQQTQEKEDDGHEHEHEHDDRQKLRPQHQQNQQEQKFHRNQQQQQQQQQQQSHNKSNSTSRSYRFFLRVVLLFCIITWQVYFLINTTAAATDANNNDCHCNDNLSENSSICKNSNKQTIMKQQKQQYTNKNSDDHSHQHQHHRQRIAYISQGPASTYQNVQDRIDRISKGRDRKKVIEILQVHPNYSNKNNPLFRLYDNANVTNHQNVGSNDNNDDDDDDATAILFFHTYDEPCRGCIFEYGTTIAAGRNLALLAAIQSPYWDSFSYVVFIDNDLSLVHIPTIQAIAGKAIQEPWERIKETNPEALQVSWQIFHDMLLLDETFTYPIVKPRDKKFDFVMHGIKQVTTYQSFVDDNFWAIRRDYVSFFYPFSEYAMNINRWVNVISIWVRMERCFPAGIMVHGDYLLYNEGHTYSKKQKVNPPGTENLIRTLLNLTYPELEPWYVPKEIYKHFGSIVKYSPSYDVHGYCKELSDIRFEKFIHGTLELYH